MALIPPQTPERATLNIPTILYDAVTCPTNYELNIHEILLTNKTVDKHDLTVNMLVWMDDIQEYFYILKNQPVPIGMSFNLSGINLKANDVLKCYTNHNNALDGSFFYLKRDVNPNIAVIYPSRFNRTGSVLTTTNQDVYLTAPGVITNIHDLFICNVGEDNASSVTIELVPSTGAVTKLLNNVYVPPNDIIFLDGINLKAGDKIRAKSNKDYMINIVANILESQVS